MTRQRLRRDTAAEPNPPQPQRGPKVAAAEGAPRRPRLRARVGAMLAASALAGCGADGTLTPYTPAPMATRALTDTVLVAGTSTVTLPVAGVAVTSRLEVRPVGAATCTALLEVESALPDGTCKLTLRFGQRSDGPGLALTAATLVARGDAGPCAPLAARLPAGTDPVTYALSESQAWLPWSAPPAPAGATLQVDKVLVELRGSATLKAGTDTLVLGDRSVRIGGDLVGTASAAVACTPCAGPACASPYPPYRLRDAQPKSAAHNLEYSLDRWLGQHLVVILTQGW